MTCKTLEMVVYPDDWTLRVDGAPNVPPALHVPPPIPAALPPTLSAPPALPAVVAPATLSPVLPPAGPPIITAPPALPPLPAAPALTAQHTPAPVLALLPTLTNVVKPPVPALTASDKEDNDLVHDEPDTTQALTAHDLVLNIYDDSHTPTPHTDSQGTLEGGKKRKLELGDEDDDKENQPAAKRAKEGNSSPLRDAEIMSPEELQEVEETLDRIAQENRDGVYETEW